MKRTVYQKLERLILLFILVVIPSISTATEAPKLFVQLGHSKDIESVACSPDGKYAISGGWDGLKLWEVQTGREIKTLKGHTEGVFSVAFSPDGKYALSGSGDHTLKLWEMPTGRLIRTFTGHSQGAILVAFSPDGKYAVSASDGFYYGRSDGSVKLWEVSSGKEIKAFSGHSKDVNAVAFSPNGQYALSGSYDATMKLWDVSTGQEVRTFKKNQLSSGINAAAFTFDGKHVLAGDDYGYMTLWEISTGREVWSIKGSGNIHAIAVSPNNKYIISGNTKKTLELWKMSTGTVVKSFKGHARDINSVAFLPDGKHIISGSSDQTMKLWDVATGKNIRTFEGNITGIGSISVSPDGNYVLSDFGLDLNLWNIKTGKLERTMTGHKDIVGPVAFSNDSRYALSGGSMYNGIADNTIKLWDVATGKIVRSFEGHTNAVTGLEISPDGQVLLTSSVDATLRLWDVATGMEIRQISESPDSSFWSVTFDKKGKRAIARMDTTVDAFQPTQGLKIYNIKSGREIRSFPLSGFGVIAFSPDRKYYVQQKFELTEAFTGRIVRKYSTSNHPGHIPSIAFSPDARYFLTGAGDHSVMLWDVPSGQNIKSFSGHSGSVNSVAFTKDGNHIASGSEDGTVRLWNVSSGKEIAQMIMFKDKEWIFITPEGYYNSSANGDKNVNVLVADNVFSIDQYRSTFYKPQVVEAALRLSDTRQAIAETLGSAKDKVTLAQIGKIDPPFIVIKSPQDRKRIKAAKTNISLYIEDRNRPVKWVKIYINGRQVTGADTRGISVNKKTVKTDPGRPGINIPEGKKTLDITVPALFEKGENVIEVVAYNGHSEGRKSIQVRLAEKSKHTSPSILPNLWILSIGINKYLDASIPSLSYAVADAHSIVNTFKRQKGILFREVNSLIISDKSPILPTTENILDNLEYLGQAGHRDVILLFIAGHGINDPKGDFYFLPNDASFTPDGRIKKSKAILWRLLNQTLDLPAKKLIFVDTCHAEGVGGKKTKTRAVDNDRFVKELQEANAVIFTSSRGSELSQEDPKWGHGAFTYALIQGLSGKADLIKDNKISMKELDTYVSETVPQLTHGAQHPITNTPDGYINFPVALIK